MEFLMAGISKESFFLQMYSKDIHILLMDFSFSIEFMSSEHKKEIQQKYVQKNHKKKKKIYFITSILCVETCLLPQSSSIYCMFVPRMCHLMYTQTIKKRSSIYIFICLFDHRIFHFILMFKVMFGSVLVVYHLQLYI